MKQLLYIAVTVFVGLVCYLIGRQNITEKTEYVKMYPVSGFSEIPVSFIENMPTVPILLYFTDSTGKIEIDTAAMVRDWITERQYQLTLFDSPELGKFTIYPTVQYNKLQPVRYEFVPIQKIQYKTPVWQPFFSASYSTMGYAGVGGGLFYHNIGLEYQYLKGLKNIDNGHIIGLKYKF